MLDGVGLTNLNLSARAIFRLWLLASSTLMLIWVHRTEAQPQYRCRDVFSLARSVPIPHGTMPVTTDLARILDLLFFENASGLRHFQEVWRSQEFRQYLQERGQAEMWQENLPVEGRWNLIVPYVDFFMRAFRNEALYEHLREPAILRRLQLHGHQANPALSGRENLRQLSRMNFRRVLGNQEYTSRPEMREAEQLVDQLELFLAHNSTIMRTPPGYPLLAPVALEGMGLKHFAASSKDFNRHLGSTDFVYFFVALAVKGKTQSVRSQYGDYGVIVRDDYAKEHAWLSPFIMNPNQIGFAIRTQNPELAAQILRQRSIKSAQLHQALPYLHEWDFTFADFTKLFRQSLLLRLAELKSQSPSGFANFNAQLKDFIQQTSAPRRGFPGVPHFIWEMAFPQEVFPPRFEGRIPIGVPERYLLHFSR